MTAPSASASAPLVLGRYALCGEIASGGMATVYFGRLMGPAGFSRVVAVKRMHAELARDRDFVMMFVDEASLAARVQHPNVVGTLDVLADGGEVFIVMDYVRGESLAGLLRASRRQATPVPVPVAVGVLVGALSGLHAAHEARGEGGQLLGIVHRDVSPQNILVGVDGTPRIVDFGVAKAASRLGPATAGNEIKGKIGYMSPEQLRADAMRSVDRRADVFAAGVVLWEALAGTRLFMADTMAATIRAVASAEVPDIPRGDLPPGLMDILRRALARDREARFPTCEAFADALERVAAPLASPRVIAEWVRSLVADALALREARVLEMETVLSRPAPAADPAIPRPPPSAPGSPPRAALNGTMPLGASLPLPPSARAGGTSAPPDSAPSRRVPLNGTMPLGASLPLPPSALAPLPAPPPPAPPPPVAPPPPPSFGGASAMAIPIHVPAAQLPARTRSRVVPAIVIATVALSVVAGIGAALYLRVLSTRARVDAPAPSGAAATDAHAAPGPR